MNLDKSENGVINSASAWYSRPTAPPFAVAATLIGLLYAGTGGFYSPANTALVPQWTNAPAVTISAEVPVERKRPAQETSVPKAILQIRDRLGLKMSEVADIFGVSRQAVYLWLKGENLKNEYVQRVWQLRLIAERMQLAGIDRPEHFIHRPLSPEGESLFQLLSSGASVDSALALLEEQSMAERSSRDKSIAEHQTTRHRKQDLSSLMELATPILEEVDG